MSLAYLLDPNKQFQDKDGKNATNGFIRVYIDGTDDRATTYRDFDETMNTADIRLDNNGRAVVIVDKARTYRLEVYGRNGSLLWTQRPLFPMSAQGVPDKNEIVYVERYTDFRTIYDYIKDGKTVLLKMGSASNFRIYYPYTIILPNYENDSSQGIIDFVELDAVGTSDVVNPFYPDPSSPDHFINDTSLYFQSCTVKTSYDSDDQEWKTEWTSIEYGRCASFMAFRTWMQWIESRLSNVSGGVSYYDYDEYYSDPEVYDKILADLDNGILPVIQDGSILYYFDFVDLDDNLIFHSFVYEVGAYIGEVVVSSEGLDFKDKTLLIYKESIAYDNLEDGLGNVVYDTEANCVTVINFDSQQFNMSIHVNANWVTSASGKAKVIIKDIVPKAAGVSVIVRDADGNVYSLASDSLQTLFDAGSYAVDIDGDVVRITMLNSSQYKMKSIGTQDIYFNGGVASIDTQTNYRYVLDDWDGAWSVDTVLVNPPGGYNINVVVRFVNVQCSLAQGMQLAVSGGMTKVGDSLDRIYNGRSYELTIFGNSWYLTEIYNTDVLYVTDDDLKNAIAVIKSRIVYTIPIGSVGCIEQIKLDANGTDIALHATLFNPNMDQDLNADSNVVVNFGSSGNNFSGSEFMLFAIYEYDRINRIWIWVANTAAIENTNSNVTGIQHYPLAYRDANKTKLESAHLYLFVCAGRKNTVEIMGNQLEANLNMSAQSLAIATGKQNNGGYTGAANFGTDFATLDLSTFSEAQANSRVGNQQAARVFAALTNLQNMP